MRESRLAVLFLSCALAASDQTTLSGWKFIKDSKRVCQIAVPQDWTPTAEGSGAAFLNDPATAIAVVTSQPGQTFRALSQPQLKALGLSKERIFENSARRLFYQDKVSRNPDDPNAYSAMTPGDGCTCSCRVVFGRNIPEETARKIVGSLAPVKDGKPHS